MTGVMANSPHCIIDPSFLGEDFVKFLKDGAVKAVKEEELFRINKRLRATFRHEREHIGGMIGYNRQIEAGNNIVWCSPEIASATSRERK